VSTLDPHAWSRARWMRGTAEAGLRVRTDAWRRMVRHRLIHAVGGAGMIAMQIRPSEAWTDIPGVTIRRSTAADWGDVTAFLDRYDKDSRRSTLSPDHPTPSLEIPVTRDEPGGMLLAEWRNAVSEDPVIVGLISWKPLGRRRPLQADASIVLAFGWAARGVGSALLSTAAAEARHHGMAAFVIAATRRGGDPSWAEGGMIRPWRTRRTSGANV
jgi:GNAT superfamily N-acetyltransferase